MQIKIEALAKSRALAGGLVLGAAVGVLLGGAYLAGAVEREADAHTRVQRLTKAAASGFSEDALRAETGAMTPGVLAVARRHDPISLVGAGLRDRQAPELASLLVKTGDTGTKGLMLRASYPAPVSPARPFHFAGGDALDSTRDLDCLTDAVYYEARGESPAGQAAVAQVVLNRVRHPAFPKTVCGVVFQGAYTGDTCQFSFACDGSMRHARDPEAWRRSEKVAARALEGFVMPSVGNATHFHVAGLNPGWGPSLLRVAQIGLHVFYRFGGYAGASASFNSRPQHSGDAPQAAPHAVYASLAPLPGLSADGRPMGQFMAAVATLASGQPAAPAAASPAGDPGAKQDIAGASATAKAPVRESAAPSTEAQPKAAAKAKADPSDKALTTASAPRPQLVASAT